MTEAEVQLVAVRVLGQTLREAGFETARVEARPDHADEDALFVTVRFKPGSGVTSGHATGSALVALGDALEASGEYRFPYLLYEYPDDPAPFADDVYAAE